MSAPAPLPVAATRLLLVQAAAPDVELTLRSLERSGLAVEVAVARDGEEALERLVGHAAPAELPHLVLADRELPKVDGLDLVRQLRGHPRTRALPVVVFTSGTDELDVRRCYEAGANSCVAKPVDFAAFDQVVAQLGAYWLRVSLPAR